MEMNDGALVDVSVEQASGMVVLAVGEKEFLMSPNEACKILEVLYGCKEKEVIVCKHPLVLMHAVCPMAEYQLYNTKVASMEPDELLAVIKPHEAIWLKLRLEHALMGIRLR